MPEQEPFADRYLLNEGENRRIFEQWIAGRKFAHLTSVAEPSVQFFGGQPGAGKSAAQEALVAQLRDRDGFYGVAQVIGDELRAYHPAYAELLEQDDSSAAFYTDRDSARWIEASIEHVTSRGAHLVLEGTMRSADVTLRTAADCRARGYLADAHVMAVHEFVSRARIFQRYLGQVRASGHGRYTLPEAHDRAYNALPDTVDALARSGAFRTISLYDANANLLVTVDPTEPASASHLGEALANQRTSQSVDKLQLLEIHDEIQGDLATAAPNIVADLATFKHDLESL